MLLRRFAFLLGWLLGGGALLAGCGGGNDEQPQVRLANLSTAQTALDLEQSGNAVATGVPGTSVSAYTGLDEGSYRFDVWRSGSGTTSASVDQTLAKDGNYTLVAYTSSDALKLLAITEDEDATSDGKAKFRVVNLARDAGDLDVYVTAADTDLADVSPYAASPPLATLGGYGQISGGSYRVRVTAAGDKTDLRLDIPSASLASGEVLTLFLASSTGGVLVHGALLHQGGALKAARNTSARVRLVAGVESNGVVALQLGSATVSSGLRSPSVGAYVLVAAGTPTPQLEVDGEAVTAASQSFDGGSDATLAVLGTGSAAQVLRVDDDNRPAGNSGNAKLRLFHGINGLGATLTLTANYSPVATDLAFGQASTALSIAEGVSYQLDVTSPARASSLLAMSAVNLSAGGVYTLFMLGDATSAVASLRRDR